MTREEIITGLRTSARAADDAALAAEAEVNAHAPEFDRVAATIADSGSISYENHVRSVELFPYAVTARHEAQRLRAEAALFRVAANLIEKMSDGR